MLNFVYRFNTKESYSENVNPCIQISEKMDKKANFTQALKQINNSSEV